MKSVVGQPSGWVFLVFLLIFSWSCLRRSRWSVARLVLAERDWRPAGGVDSAASTSVGRRCVSAPRFCLGDSNPGAHAPGYPLSPRSGLFVVRGLRLGWHAGRIGWVPCSRSRGHVEVPKSDPYQKTQRFRRRFASVACGHNHAHASVGMPPWSSAISLLPVSTNA